MSRFAPRDERELEAIVAAAVAREEPLELVAGGSKRGLGRPLQRPHTLDLSAFAGIRSYEPEELVLTAGAATPLAEIEAALAEKRQMLAFEPGDWRALHRQRRGAPTIGGVLACNLAGPRRIRQGAARDHFLGFHAVSGRGEAFKAGGRVVKNVTGYDLPKLMAGSYGTLAALTEVTVKVLPRARGDAHARARRPRRWGCAARAGRGAQQLARGQRRGASAGRRSRRTGRARILRLEGPVPSVEARADGARGTSLPPSARPRSWATRRRSRCGAGVRDVAPFAALGDRALWRCSVAPSAGPALAALVARALDCAAFLRLGRRPRVARGQGCRGWRRGGDPRRAGAGATPPSFARRDALRAAVPRVPAAGARRSPRSRRASRTASTRAASSIAAACIATSERRCRPISPWPSSPIPSSRRPTPSCAPASIAASATRPARPMCCSATSSTGRAAASISSRTCSSAARLRRRASSSTSTAASLASPA